MRNASVLCAFLAAGLASPAPAAIVFATYDGVVTNGRDGRNLFKSGYNLDGVAFRAIFRIDLAVPHSESFATGPNYIDIVKHSGSENSPHKLPFINGYIIVNGKRSAIGALSSLEGQFVSGGYSGIEHDATFSITSNGITVERVLDIIICSTDTSAVQASGYTAPYSFTASAPSCGGGIFRNFIFDRKTNRFDETQLILDPQRLSIRSTVPEPLTWIMMIFGMTSVGITMRRARQGKAETATNR